MASQIQYMIYEGYLVSDPESRFLDNGTEVCNFRFGSNREWKSGDEKKKETTWIKAVAWGGMASVVKMLGKKGSHVVVVGRLRPDATGNPAVFERKDGTSGSSFEMVATEIRFLDSKGGGASEGASAGTTAEDEFPF
jgi:single-strand DNA-binding protein